MTTRIIKLFPTPTNTWQNGEMPSPWTVEACVAWLQDQLKRVPEDERSTLVISIPEPVLTWPHYLSAEEASAEKQALMLDAIHAAANAGMSRDLAADLLRRIAELG